MKNTNIDFFLSMGSGTIEKTDEQMLFIYQVELKLNEEMKILREEKEKREKYKKNGGDFIEFEIEDDDEDEDPC